jgi:exodeoxyribonuclease VII large subunit
MSEIFSLYELNRLIREALGIAFPRTMLVTAEIASCDVKNHCYMALVDKVDDVIRAETRAVIWANRYRSIAPRFQETTGTKLTKGIKILFEAEVSFHERYGLKLNILDIDPSYTVGELAVKRKEILEKLAKEGLTDRNSALQFPLVPQRIGIISSATAAGYDDLITHLKNNVYGYRFTTKLYEAVMQGDRAEESILSAISRCVDVAACLDVVVIVRGGGGQTDLHCFDSYEIGRAIAMFPLPVISGIGHQRDTTVVDEVSNKRAKTPTAVADLIITKIKDFDDRLDLLSHSMIHNVRQMTSDLREMLSSLSQKLKVAAGKKLADNLYQIDSASRRLKYALRFIKNEKQKIRVWENSVNYLNPQNVLKRGYSIAYSNGSAVRSISDIEKGDSIRTVLFEGEIVSRVESKKKNRRRLL